MKALVDEKIPLITVEELRLKGFDVTIKYLGPDPFAFFKNGVKFKITEINSEALRTRIHDVTNFDSLYFQCVYVNGICNIERNISVPIYSSYRPLCPEN